MKKVVFITGTRADYGKIKSLIKAMSQTDVFSVYIYITGMHLMEEYGSTYKQVVEDNVHHAHDNVQYGWYLHVA